MVVTLPKTDSFLEFLLFLIFMRCIKCIICNPLVNLNCGGGNVWKGLKNYSYIM